MTHRRGGVKNNHKTQNKFVPATITAAVKVGDNLYLNRFTTPGCFYAGGEPRSLYIIGANLYNIEKEIFYPTVSYIEKRASSRSSYFSGGRKAWMIAQIQKNPKLPAADCSGMEIGYMRKFGIKTFDATANSLCSNSHSTKIGKSALKPGDWVGKDGHIGTYVGGGYVVEFYGGAFTCALTALNSRTAYNFITKRLSTGSA